MATDPATSNEHGLTYDRTFLDSLPVLQPRPSPHEPVRALSAEQFSTLHLRHLLAHPPDSVLFPFLHGVEGDNHAQNLFFASAAGDEHGHLRFPDFRGLIWVSADDAVERKTPPTPAWSDEDDSELDSPASEFAQALTPHEDAFGMPMDVDPDAEGMQSKDPNSLPHMHPVAHRGPLAPSPSTTTVTTTAATAMGRTSSSSSSNFDILDYASVPSQPPTFSNAHDRRASDASTTSSLLSDEGSLFDSHARSLTASTVLTSPTSSPPGSPCAGPHSPLLHGSGELKRPHTRERRPAPRELPLFTSTFRPHELLKIGPAGLEPCFAPPRVPDGISLRNFGIQVPIYATLSDVVVYSARGDVHAAQELANKFKLAIEAKADERQRRYPCGESGARVKYNVFVLQASSEEIETHLPHLLKRAIDQDRARSPEVPQASCPYDPSDQAASPKTYAIPGIEGLDTVSETRLPHLNGTLGLTVNTNLSAGSQLTQRSPALHANTVDFAQREKEEMRELTRATEIFSVLPPASAADVPAEITASTTHTYWDPAVGQLFLGNASDVPASDGPTGPALSPRAWHARSGSRVPALAREAGEFDHGPNEPAMGLGFDVCVECHDMAPFPSSAHLRAAEDHVRLLDALWAERCAARGVDRTVRPPPHPSAVIHLPFPSSPPNTSVTVSALMPFIAFLERVLAPAGVEPAAGTSPRSVAAAQVRTRPLKVLVYSQDGYTESSVLVLSLLMALRGLTLPESYLELQVEKRRSFFVYGSDLGVLKRVETKVLKERGQLAVRRGSISAHHWGGTPPTAGERALQSRTVGRPPSSSVSMAPGLGPFVGHPASAGASPPPSAFVPQTLPVRRPRASTSPMLPSVFGDHQQWFSDPRFDGSFPSRVLPFLYLGNLNHATNAYMLHALGITHVVSVGECALVPPPGTQGPGGVARGPQGHGHGSLWIEEREGRISVLDIKGVCDDGIDTLEPQLAPACAWIERARLAGGNVLVHCRVGVSRSATVTIAYVMQHLRVSLVDAYLIVRSRRLSVLIQPNMRLLYSLLGWEVRLARERAGEEEGALRKELARCLNWPYLAKEVHALNEKYLQ